MRPQSILLGVTLATVLLSPIAAVAELDAGYKELQGPWQATELVDNGRAIAPESISTWLPSCGHIEIVDNAIMFTSTKDGQRHAHAFAIDATTYPRKFNVIDNNKVTGHGIYRIEDGRLVVCLSPPSAAPRPEDFSARENSQRMLIVFARPMSQPSDLKSPTAVASAPPKAPQTPATPPPAAPVAPAPAVKPLTDVDVANLLPGTWAFNDAHGAFFLALDPRGTYSTYRQTVETSAFQKVFRKLPLSSGTWKLNNGQVSLTCTSSIYPDRIWKMFPFTIRSVSATSLEFIDYAGNAGKAVRSTQAF